MQRRYDSIPSVIQASPRGPEWLTLNGPLPKLGCFSSSITVNHIESHLRRFIINGQLFPPRMIVDDFDKPRRETVVQRSGAVLRKQVSGELDPLLFSWICNWVWMQQDLRQVRMLCEGTLGRHAQKARMDWRKKFQTSAPAAGGAAHDCFQYRINPGQDARMEGLKKDGHPMHDASLA